MSEDQQDQAEKDPFYVGYFPLPKAYFMPLLLLVILMIGGGVAMGIGLSAQQGDPGDGVWDLSQQVEIKGRVSLSPVPMLIEIEDNPYGIKGPVPLVNEGKFGTWQEMMKKPGHLVTVKGHLLHREGSFMLEIPASGENLIVDHAGPGDKEHPERISLGQKTLTGEIIDSKCFLGAMKPGQGKTHKACAILCLKGGIPPAFVVWEEGKVKEIYLIETPLKAFDREKDLFPYVGDRVDIKGEVFENGDWPIFRINAKSIAPWSK